MTDRGGVLKGQIQNLKVTIFLKIGSKIKISHKNLRSELEIGLSKFLLETAKHKNRMHQLQTIVYTPR